MSEALETGKVLNESNSPACLVYVIPALGIAQIVSWGSLYYAFAVLSKSIQVELQLSQPVLFGAFTSALLMSSLCSPHVGKAIDRFGGKRILCAGSVLAAAALLMQAFATDIWSVYTAWVLAGVAMPMALYDPAFATLHQIDANRYRRSVSALTLFGGFASTAFWPLTAYLNAEVGWRVTLMMFAAFQVAICLPLHAFILPKLSGRRSIHPKVASPTAGEPARQAAARRLYLLGGAFAAALFVFGALSAHLLNLLQVGGLSTAQAVMVASVIGPMQVTGRALELFFAKRLPPATIGMLSIGLLFLSLILLACSSGDLLTGFVFAALYGLSNGLLTIVRGTLPAVLFPEIPVGNLLGRLARPALLSMAIAPLCFSVVSSTGLSFVTRTLALACLASLAAVLLIAATRRPTTQTPVATELELRS